MLCGWGSEPSYKMENQNKLYLTYPLQRAAHSENSGSVKTVSFKMLHTGHHKIRHLSIIFLSVRAILKDSQVAVTFALKFSHSFPHLSFIHFHTFLLRPFHCTHREPKAEHNLLVKSQANCNAVFFYQSGCSPAIFTKTLNIQRQT